MALLTEATLRRIQNFPLKPRQIRSSALECKDWLYVPGFSGVDPALQEIQTAKQASRLKRHSGSFVKKIASALLGNRGRGRRASRYARARRAMRKDVEKHQCHEHNEYQKKQSAHGGVLFAANLPFLLRN
jgi:hypothetical protein